jgi:hypothetical protein
VLERGEEGVAGDWDGEGRELWAVYLVVGLGMLR